MNADVRTLLDSLDGLRIDGGCQQCDADTTMRVDGDGVYVATIRHDDWCPELARRRRTQR